MFPHCRTANFYHVKLLTDYYKLQKVTNEISGINYSVVQK